MIVEIFDKSGKRVAFMDAPPDQIDLNVPKGGRFKEVAAEVMARGGRRTPRTRKPKAAKS